MKITLEWPSRILSPNSRSHWRVKHKETKRARKNAYEKTLMSGYNNEWLAGNDGMMVLSLAFYPPDKRKRDDDNLIAMMKPSRDGIAAALGIDDSRFKTIVEVMPPVGKNKKRVEIEIYGTGHKS